LSTRPRVWHLLRRRKKKSCATLETGDNVLFEIARKIAGRPLNFAVTVEQDGKKVTLREPDEIRRLIGGHPDDEHRAYLQIVDYLVRHGIDVNARLLETDQTSLFMPAESGQADVLALMLLGSGVNVNHRDKAAPLILKFE
jgi:hypothetical protein